MRFDHHHYVPCLRWKQGEYQAVSTLTGTSLNRITPLIEVPEIGFDFESRSASRTVDQHLAPFAKRVSTKWGRRHCFIDALHITESPMADGRDPITYIFDTLRAEGCLGIPTIGLSKEREYTEAVKRIAAQDSRGVCLRVNLEEAANSDFKTRVNALLRSIGVSVANSDLTLDLGAPNFEPVEGLARLLESLFLSLPHLTRWRTITLLGTSFPRTMAEVRHSPAALPRYEWLLYKRLVASPGLARVRLPTFGDYGISFPEVLIRDPRLLKPAATIRYTTDDGWLIAKGNNVRDNGFEQYRNLCRTIQSSSQYKGPEFSDGDKYISQCAAGGGKTGNLTTWRKVGTNHHLENVVQDISKLFGSSVSP